MNTQTQQTTPRFNYTHNAWQGTNYEKSSQMSTAELTKEIRNQLKNNFPTCKFSVSKKSYSGGRSIKVALMEAPFKVFAEPNIEVCARSSKFGTPEWKMECWKDTIKQGHHQINQFWIKDDFYLTEEARELLTKALGIVQSYNFDDSDSMIDYFHTNFYLHASIGKYDKPFIKT